MCGIYARGPIGQPNTIGLEYLTDEEQKELKVLFDKISEREFADAIKKYEEAMLNEKSIEYRVNTLIAELDSLVHEDKMDRYLTIQKLQIMYRPIFKAYFDDDETLDKVKHLMKTYSFLTGSESYQTKQFMKQLAEILKC